MAYCIRSFPGSAYIAYAVGVQGSKGTADYAVAPQGCGCNKCSEFGLAKLIVFLTTEPKGMDLTVTERVGKESDWLLVVAVQDAADA